MARTLKQTKTKIGTTSSSTWTWKQVTSEYWDDNYLDTNKSITKVQTYIGRASGSSTASFGGTATTKVTCDSVVRSKSQSWNYQSFWISGGSWKLIQEEEFEVEHDDDGTKKITVSSSLSTSDFNPNSCSASEEITLTTIPRASQIGVTDANIGKTSTITINKTSDAFTTSLFYRVKGNEDWISIVEKTTLQSYAFSVPTSFYALIPDSPTIDCEFKADTYNEDTLIGESDIVTATFTATGSPVIDSTNSSIVDTNSTTVALTGSASKIVKYASIVKATIKATPQNSSTIKQITVNGIVATLSTKDGITTGIVTINGPNSNVFSVVVTDSRGYSTTTNITVDTSNYVSYIPLTISSYSVERNSSTDGIVNISIGGNYYNGSFGVSSNSLTVQYRCKEKGTSFASDESSWVTINNSNYTYSITDFQVEDIDYQKQYDFELRVIDKITSQKITGLSIAKGIPIINWEEEFFNVNGEIRKDDVSIFLLMYPIGSVYVSVSDVSPDTLFGGTWKAISNSTISAIGYGWKRTE